MNPNELVHLEPDFMVFVLAVVLVALGFLTRNAKPGTGVGIRTKATRTNHDVWTATNRRAGVSFLLAAPIFALNGVQLLLFFRPVVAIALINGAFAVIVLVIVALLATQNQTPSYDGVDRRWVTGGVVLWVIGIVGIVLHVSWGLLGIWWGGLIVAMSPDVRGMSRKALVGGVGGAAVVGALLLLLVPTHHVFASGLWAVAPV